MSNQITIGSCFAGIGGFELGLERGIPNSKTVWQIEKNKYCQTILQKHWPDATKYDDIREIDYDKIQTVDIICGGFPCQDISAAGKGKGIEHGDRSSLWRQMHRLINHLQPRVAVLENVPALLWKNRGMHIVMHDLASIGYDAEWCTISARQFGAPHLRKRVFIVAYPHSTTKNQPRKETEIDQFSPTKSTNVHKESLQQDGQKNIISENIQHRRRNSLLLEPAHTNSTRTQIQVKREQPSKQMFGSSSQKRRSFWSQGAIKSPICRVDDGISRRVDRIKALGNAIVPQCSEYIGKKIYESNLLDYKY